MSKEIQIFKEEDIKITDESSLSQISKFLEEQVDISKSLQIDDPWNTKLVQSIKKMKQGYVKNRNTIARVFKADRDSHTQHNRANREVELKIIAIMEEEESRLSLEIEKAEFERIKEERRKLIPFRKEELAKYEATATDDDLLALSDEDFEKFLTQKREYWTKKEEARIERERMLEEARKQAEKEKQEAIQREREAAERKAKEERERAEREKKEAEERAEREKQLAIQQERERQAEIERKAKEREEAIIAEQKAKEQARLDAIEAERKAKEEAEQKAKEEREKAEKNAKFKKWLTDNNFDSSCMEWKQSGNHFEIWTLPKKIAEITI